MAEPTEADPMGPGGDDREARRQALLDAALGEAAFEGWSMAALRAGARRLGLDPEEAGILFPGGPREAVEVFFRRIDARMAAILAETDLTELKVRERVALALRTRLELLAPHKEAVRRALGYLALPGNGALAARCLYRAVDAVWRAAGDRTTDFSFYTRRGLLAGVYTATLLFWLQDQSDGHGDSWRFLDRRIAGVMRLPGLTGRLRAAAARCADRGCRRRRDRAPAGPVMEDPEAAAGGTSPG